jgi:hypothetical protein|nr:hypothetical protein [Methylocystis sp. H62]
MDVMANARHAPSLPLEFFRMEQRIGEIGAEKNGDDQSNDRFKHAVLLKAPAGPRIGANDRKKEKTEANVQNIEHVSSPRSPAA